MVAVGERGQPLDVHAEQPRERIGLSVAELGKLPGHVLHGAVPLAELYAGERARACRGRPRGGPRRRSRRGSARAPGRRCAPAGRRPRRRARRHTAPRAAAIRCCANAVTASSPGLVGEEAQRLGGEVVVVGLERLVAGLADDVGPGRATPAAVAARRPRGCSMRPSSTRLSRWRRTAAAVSPKLVGERGGGDGPALADRLQDPVARARLQGVRR